MRIIADNEAGQLRLTHDKFATELVMDYEHQFDRYELAIREGGEVTPVDPVTRLEGEHDEVFFDRASIKAHEAFLRHVSEQVNAISRAEQMQFLLGKITEKLDHAGLIIAHWDLDTPSDTDLRDLRRCYDQALKLDEALGELT